MNHALNFTAEKLKRRLSLLRQHRFRRKQMLAPFRLLELTDATVAPPLHDCTDGWPVLDWNSYWGGPDTHFVLRTRVTPPTDWTGPLALHFPIGADGDIFNHPEALLYLNGTPVASVDRHHHTIDLPDGAGEVQLALHGWTGLFGWPPVPDSQEKLFMPPCYVVERNMELESYLSYADCALETVAVLEDAAPERHGILNALDASLRALDMRDPMQTGLHDSAAHALDSLQNGLKSAGMPLDVTLHGIGHAHMDIAYLWPIDQIRQKNARTYSNVLRLMEKYPEYRFSHSQPQLYEMTRQDFPDLFEQVRDRVAEGRWEVMGGMWVEPDVNMPGAEALVRQILLGRTYFRDTFGDVETPVLWLPDTFGFPWSLPQLMKLAGLKYFVTNKLNWNQYNRMPSSTTWWQGIDGTRVLAHFLTTPREVQHLPFPTNYKSDLSAREVVGTWRGSSTKADLRDLPICYGYGDGGGGPTEDLIRRARAFADMPAMPRFRPSQVRDAMAALESGSSTLPVWNDELYMEGHRGTLTSQGWIKRANRQAEIALHEVEALLVMASPQGVDEAERFALRDAWRLVCLNQFHDILTGTSIPQVFEDARRDYKRIAQITTELRDAALKRLATEESQWHVLNTSPVPVSGAVLLPAGAPVEALHSQPVADGVLGEMPPIAPYGQASLSSARAATDKVQAGLDDAGGWLENDRLRVEVNDHGQITRLFDKHLSREVLDPDQTGNQLWAFEDRPLSWDAWDIDTFFEEKGEQLTQCLGLEIAENGPLRASLRITLRFRASLITQEIRLCAGSARLDFATEVDWHETHTLLKVAFPVLVHSPVARYEIQWGEIDRPTHRNTSWDFAKFEVPAQRWADLSEDGFGVALLNDCKHGYDIADNVMRLSLIKSATMPDPVADQGRHVFTYALLSHGGDLATVRHQGRMLNHPVTLCRGGQSPLPLVACDAETLILETLKPAEDGRGFILRLYESARRRGTAQLRFAVSVERVTRVDLLEDPVALLDHDGQGCQLDFAPFEIMSLRIEPARD